MIDERSRLMRKIDALERELEAPVDRQRRMSVNDAIRHMKQKLRDLNRVRA